MVQTELEKKRARNLTKSNVTDNQDRIDILTLCAFMSKLIEVRGMFFECSEF